MLAALLATRPISPTTLFFGNQLVAATTVFSCITITTRAGFISTDPAISYKLRGVYGTAKIAVSGQDSGAAVNVANLGANSLWNTLLLIYRNIKSQHAANSPIFLSTSIAQSILAVTALLGILAGLPVNPADLSTRAQLQQQAALALRILYSLAVPPNALSFT